MALMRQLNPDDRPEPENEKKTFNRILTNSDLALLVAEHTDSFVGSCYLNLIPNITRGGKPYALIENVITDKRFRNRGAGKALVDHALQMARERGCYKIMLMSGRGDDAVHSFYRRCGFDDTEKRAYILRPLIQ